MNWLKTIGDLLALAIPPLRRLLDRPTPDEIEADHADALGEALDAADRKPSRPEAVSNGDELYGDLPGWDE